MAAFERSEAIDLTTIGTFVDMEVSGVDQVTAVVLDKETWGAGVVEVRRLVAGDEVPYSPAKTLSAASPTLDALAVEDVQTVRLVVTTAGTGIGRIALAGKEVRAWQP